MDVVLKMHVLDERLRRQVDALIAGKMQHDDSFFALSFALLQSFALKCAH